MTEQRTPEGTVHVDSVDHRDAVYVQAQASVDDGVLTVYDTATGGSPPIQFLAPGQWRQAWFDGEEGEAVEDEAEVVEEG